MFMHMCWYSTEKRTPEMLIKTLPLNMMPCRSEYLETGSQAHVNSKVVHSYKSARVHVSRLPLGK